MGGSEEPEILNCQHACHDIWSRGVFVLHSPACLHFSFTFFSVRDELECEESIFDLLRIIYWIEKCEQLLLLQCYLRFKNSELFDIF